ncbi:MAG: hypothetical protein E7267_00130 [Lachnospiraceae bacterium]|nr:hypothetical protein [Lachnospiraceae bacterium]
MFEYIAESLVFVLIKHKKVNIVDRDIYIYGLEVILLNGILMISFLIMSIWFNMLFHFVAFVIFFIPLRIFMGGYHAKRSETCFIISNVMYLISLVINKSSESWHHNAVVILLSILILITMFVWSPVKNKNRPLADCQYKRNKIITFVIVVIDFALLFIFYKFDLRIFSSSIAFILLSGITFFVGKLESRVRHKKESDIMKRIKNLFVIMLMACLIILNKNTYVSAAQEIKASDNEYIYATEILTQYYQAIDQYKEYDFSGDIDSVQLLDYINSKIETKRYKQVYYGMDDMQNYSVNFKLLDSEKIDDYTKMTIVSDVEFKYKDASFESGYREEIQLILNNKFNKYNIVDWYLPYEDYDTRIRGDIENISNPGYWNSMLRITDKIHEKQEELNEKIKLYYDDLKKQASESVIEIDNSNNTTRITPYATLYSLNKSKMVTWANNNCTKANPTSGNSGQAPYYDFSQISGNYDCTNFVSHAILAGGAVVYNTGGSGISDTGWYYTNLNNRSSSWSGVPKLCSFLTSNTTRGPVGTKISYSDIYVPGGNYPYVPGDILQFHNGSKWRHSTVIVGYIAISGSATKSEAVVTGRTSSTVCNNNVRQSTIYSGENRRVIKLNGYYK